MCRVWVPTVLVLRYRVEAMPLSDMPSAINRSTSFSRSVSSPSGPSSVLEQGDQVRVDDGASADDPVERDGELRGFENSVLEEVTGVPFAAGEQSGGVLRDDVLGEHQDAQPGVFAAEPGGGAQALVGVGWRHPDVDDDGIGVVRGDRRGERLGAGHGVDDGMSVVGE